MAESNDELDDGTDDERSESWRYDGLRGWVEEQRKRLMETSVLTPTLQQQRRANDLQTCHSADAKGML